MKNSCIIVLFILLFSALRSYAQSENLLLNGDFEDSDKCILEAGGLEESKYWLIPNKSTPDLFRYCKDSMTYYNVPLNFIGKQEAHSGKSYAGIVAIAAPYPNYREYIQGTLIQPLIPNKTYRITFYINWPRYSMYFISRLGYLFSPKSLKQPGTLEKGSEITYSNLLTEGTGFINLEIGQLINRDWHKVEFDYTAKGDEQFFTLGVFGNTINKKEYKTSISNNYSHSEINKVAYYYIDNISIIELSITESNTLGK